MEFNISNIQPQSVTSGRMQRTKEMVVGDREQQTTDGDKKPSAHYASSPGKDNKSWQGPGKIVIILDCFLRLDCVLMLCFVMEKQHIKDDIIIIIIIIIWHYSPLLSRLTALLSHVILNKWL